MTNLDNGSLEAMVREQVVQDLLTVLWAGVQQRISTPVVNDGFIGLLNGLTVAVAVAANGLPRDAVTLDIDVLVEAGKQIAMQHGPR